jgi:outer membrane lipoprotein SlyB
MEKGGNMEPQTRNSTQPLIWVAAISLILFCGAGVSALMGWIPSSIGTPGAPALTTLDKQSATAAHPATAKLHSATSTTVPPPMTAATKCAECGVIQSVHKIDVKGEGSGLGAVGGAVVGGVLGNQIGGGNGKKIMTAVGAVGGAVAGNEIEKRVKSTKSYEVTVHFDDGSSRVFTEANTPTWRNGDKVRVINGVIQSNA